MFIHLFALIVNEKFWMDLNDFFFRKMWIMLIVYYATLFHCLYVTIFVGKLTVLRILFKSRKVLTVEEPCLGFHFYVIDIKWWMFWRRVGIGLVTPSHLIFTQHLGIYWQCENGCVHNHTSVKCFLYSATTTNKVQPSLVETQMTTLSLTGIECLRRKGCNLIYFWFPPHWKKWWIL